MLWRGAALDSDGSGGSLDAAVLVLPPRTLTVHPAALSNGPRLQVPFRWTARGRVPWRQGCLRLHWPW